MVTTELGACEWFVWDLRRSNLIDRGRLDQVIGEFLNKNPRAEPPGLADYLISQNILTPFQAERLELRRSSCYRSRGTQPHHSRARRLLKRRNQISNSPL